MGMDLVDAKNESHTCSMNWTGWSLLRGVLIDLYCDISEMKQGNDGDLISEKTCKAWAEAINKALENGRVSTAKIPDPTYVGGFRSEIWIDRIGGEPGNSWLKAVADFLGSCHGCLQY